jgi:hypothetical protein
MGGYSFKTHFWAGHSDCWSMPLLTVVTRRMDPMLKKIWVARLKLWNGGYMQYAWLMALSWLRKNTNGNTCQIFLQLKPTQTISSSKPNSHRKGQFLNPTHCDNKRCNSAYHTHTSSTTLQTPNPTVMKHRGFRLLDTSGNIRGW